MSNVVKSCDWSFFQNSLMRSDFQQIGRFTRLELRWPFSIGIDLYIRDTGQADFNPGLETPEQFRIELSFDAEGQLLAFDLVSTDLGVN